MRGLCSQNDKDGLLCGHPFPCPHHPDWPPCPRCDRNHESPGDWRTIAIDARYNLIELDVHWERVVDVEGVVEHQYQGRVHLIRVCKDCRSDLLMKINEWWRNLG